MTEGIAVFLIPPNDCLSAWSRVKHHLERAILQSNGRWQPEYVLVGLVTGQQSLWVVGENNEIIGAATTEIVSYPEKRMLAIHFLGGSGFDRWYTDLLETLTRFAKDSNCNGLECVARFGFWKWFKQDGWRQQSCFYEKDVT